jgi:hypothetical protein
MAFLCFIRNKTGTGKPDSLIFYAFSLANEIGSQGVLIHFQEYYQIPHLSIPLIA